MPTLRRRRPSADPAPRWARPPWAPRRP
jgi:hypothetical protein